MEITLENVSLVYSKKTPFEKRALHNVSITFKRGTINGIIGKNGSGKSTLAQVIGGLLKPDEGLVRMDGVKLSKDNLTKIRKNIGIVFQFSEQQIFQDTVKEEVGYGLKNFGYMDEDIRVNVKEAMEFLNLPYEKLALRSPFTLSGGEMRKVAIAGIIAYKPKVLILDEPTAGLDQIGRKEILSLIHRLNKEYSMTIIVISHFIDEILSVADEVVIMNKGQIDFKGSPEILTEQLLLEENGLDVPETIKLIREINEKLRLNIPLRLNSVRDIVKQVSLAIKKT